MREVSQTDNLISRSPTISEKCNIESRLFLTKSSISDVFILNNVDLVSFFQISKILILIAMLL